jgi:glycosyltransferase involved in cell wall biosynthesis
MNHNTKIIWISSENHRRSKELAKEINIPIYILFKSSDEINYRLVRYFIMLYKMLKILNNVKPKLIISQNPSIVLVIYLILFKNIYNFKIIVDRHSNFKFNKTTGTLWKLFHFFSDLTIKKSELTIVTNEYLKRIVESKGGRGFVLQDKIPDIPQINNNSVLKRITIISSFNADEPISEIISAISEIEEIEFYITGNYRKKMSENKINKMPNNVHFTGFISENEYIELINSSNILMVLTTQDHTLTCGAYEGISISKPLILSNTDALISYFNKGAIYTAPNRIDIKKSIQLALEKEENLKIEIKTLKKELIKDWEFRFNSLKEKIKNI